MSYRHAEVLLRLCFQPWLAVACRVLFGLRLEGARHIPTEGPGLVVANHQGYFDPVFLQMAIARPVRYLLTSDFYDIGWVQPFFKLVGAIRVEKNGAARSAIKETLESLRQGRLVGIFPEGRLSLDGSFHPIQPGMAYLSAKSGVPVVPARISGSIRVLPKGQWKPTLANVTVRFGPPMHFEDPHDRTAGDRILAAWNALSAPEPPARRASGSRPGRTS